MKPSIAIFGSCVSRDIFNRMPRGSFELELYSARSSFGSIYATPPFADHWSRNLTSAFQRRTVAMDILKQAVPRLKAITPDVILVDLIDERFDLIVNKFGRCTYSLELKSAGLKRVPRLTFVHSGSADFMIYWINGWSRFIETLHERGLVDRVLINKSYWQYHTEGGVPFNRQDVDQANETLDKMYSIQKNYLAPTQFIEYGDKRSCPDDHRWSATPFHYDDASTLYSLQQVQQFIANKTIQSQTLA